MYRCRIKYFLSFLLCIVSIDLSAQYDIIENRVWAFGDRTGLDFNTEPPTLFEPAITSQEAAASVCSPTGQLLFYTNGAVIWNQNHLPMTNANPLHPGAGAFNGPTQSTTQGALIIPFINDPNLYHVFSLTQVSVGGTGVPVPPGTLYHSVVDMSLGGGLGDVDPARKFVFIQENLSEKMIAVPGDQCNIWVLVHDKHTNCFRAYEITSAGFNPTPVVSCIGNANTSNVSSTYANTYWSTGELKVSPDRKRLAAAYQQGLLIELYDFDPATGMVSNPEIFHHGTATGIAVPLSEMPYGVAFSADNNVFYTTMSDGKLFQYDLTATNPVSTRQQIGVTLDNSQMKLAHNGKIYVKGRSALGVIHNPHRLGIACAYVSSYIGITPPMSLNLGFPNEVVVARKPDTTYHLALDTILCFSSYALSGPIGFDTYEWNTGSSDLSITIQEPGTYTVLSKSACAVRVDTFRIQKDNITVNLGDDLLLCNESETALLQVAPQVGVTYRWQDGSNGTSFEVRESGIYYVQATKDACTATDTVKVRYRTIEHSLGADTMVCIGDLWQKQISLNIDPESSVLWQDGQSEATRLITDTGTYWVFINDPKCGSYSDTISIRSQMCNCEVFVPTAFTPNEDARNDQFKPLLPGGCPYQEYVLRIFDRWGKLVFSTIDLTQGWDGNIGGIPAELGTYMFDIRIVVGSDQHEKHFRGDLMLLR